METRASRRPGGATGATSIFQFARFGAGQGEEFVHQRAEALGLAADDPEIVGNSAGGGRPATGVSGRSSLIMQRLDVAADGGDRRAEFVRHVDDQFAALLLGALGLRSVAGFHGGPRATAASPELRGDVALPQSISRAKRPETIASPFMQVERDEADGRGRRRQGERCRPERLL